MKRLAQVTPSGDVEEWLRYGNNQLAFSPSGKYVAVVYGSYHPTLARGRVIVWDLAKPTAPRERVRVEGTECVAFAPRGALAYGGEHGIGYLDGSTRRFVAVPGDEWNEQPRRLAFSTSGRLAVGQLCSLAIVEPTGQVTPLPTKHQAQIEALVWSADERFLYSLDRSYLRVWNAAKPDAVKRLPIKGHQLALAPGGLVVSSARLELVPLDKNGLPGKPRVLLREQIQRCALRPDGRALAVATADELRIQMLDGSRRPAAVRQAQQWPTLAFSPDGKLLVVVEYGTMSIYDPE